MVVAREHPGYSNDGEKTFSISSNYNKFVSSVVSITNGGSGYQFEPNATMVEYIPLMLMVEPMQISPQFWERNKWGQFGQRVDSVMFKQSQSVQPSGDLFVADSGNHKICS